MIEVMLPPGQPGKPYAISITTDIQVQWTKPHHRADSAVESYVVLYRRSDQWKSQTITATQETAMLSSLAPKTTYLVKVQAINCAGKGPFSELSDPIETLLPRTGATKQLNKDIKVCLAFQSLLCTNVTFLPDRLLTPDFRVSLPFLIYSTMFLLEHWTSGN